MAGHFSDLLCLIKNGQKPYSFDAHFEQPFNATTSRTDLYKYMTFKVANQLKPTGTMKTFMKPNCKYRGTFNDPKKLHDKRVTVMNENSEIYKACQHKTTFHMFFLCTDDPV